MKFLKFVGVAVLLLAVAIPLFPAPQEAARAVASGRELTKASEHGQVAVCRVADPLVTGCRIEPRDCLGDQIRQTASHIWCREGSASDYFQPTAAEMSKFIAAAEANAHRIQTQYLIAAGVVGALGLALIFVGFRAEARSKQLLNPTGPAPSADSIGLTPTSPGKCPFCSGEIAANAARCLHCWKRLDGKPG